MKSLVILIAASLTSLSAAAAPAHKSSRPTDPQIAAILDTADQIEIDAGKLAKSASQSKDIRQFAQQMIDDQGAISRSVSQLMTKLNVTPELSLASEKLQKGGDDNLAALKKLQGRAFDKAYIDHEVKYHEALIGMLDKTLIPGASNVELKTLLARTRATLAAHVEHARKLQADLDKRAG
jgi:putative membrane protein